MIRGEARGGQDICAPLPSRELGAEAEAALESEEEAALIVPQLRLPEVHRPLQKSVEEADKCVVEETRDMGRCAIELASSYYSISSLLVLLYLSRPHTVHVRCC